MTARSDRIRGLADALAILLENEQRACSDILDSLLETVNAVRRETADRRLQRVDALLRELAGRMGLLADMARRDYLTKIGREAEALAMELVDGRAASVMGAVLDAGPMALDPFCSLVLDRVIEAASAERGIVLFYMDDSSEARVAAARPGPVNLSLREHQFSRTLLTEVFRRCAPLFVGDACHEPPFSEEASVRNYELRSVLAVPLVHDGRAVGAIYVENNSVPCAFADGDVRLLEIVARFATFYLLHARLLPATADRAESVFLDASKASREIVGRDPKILDLLTLIERIADTTATVLIEGESGTGKELVARALHYGSARRDDPFVAINCAAIPESLLESELFGHERGAFTGAVDRHVGQIEQANGGTLFLDEVSELAYPLQAKLLRVLQANEFQRLGGRETIRVDVRIVAASSRDLKALTEAGKFQEALFYRFNVIPVRLPPLRERKDDVPLLADRFLAKYCGIYGRKVGVVREVYEWLREYPFPGNVRELENLIHRLVVLARDDVVRLGDLPRDLLGPMAGSISLASDPLYKMLGAPVVDLEDLRHRAREMRRVLAELESGLVERSVREAGGNLTEAADRLGVHRVTLHKMVRRAGLRKR